MEKNYMMTQDTEFCKEHITTCIKKNPTILQTEVVAMTNQSYLMLSIFYTFRH